MNEKIRMFKVQVEPNGAAMIVKTTDEIECVFTESEPGDKIFIRVIEMTQEEIDNLPEFTGF
jgi:hypothetical protein